MNNPAKNLGAALLALLAWVAPGLTLGKTASGVLPPGAVAGGTIGMYYRDTSTPGFFGPACPRIDTGVVLFKVAPIPSPAGVATTATSTICGSVLTNVWTVAGPATAGSAYSVTATVTPPLLSGRTSTETILTVTGVTVDDADSDFDRIPVIGGWLGELDAYTSTDLIGFEAGDETLLTIDGVEVFSMLGRAQIGGGASLLLDTEAALVLENPGGVGVVSYGLDIISINGVDYHGLATLMGGVFAVSGDFVGLPWVLDSFAGQVVRATLAVGALPSTEYTITVDDGAHAIDFSRMAEEAASNSASVVPEPSSFALLAIGLLGVFGYRRTRAGRRRLTA